MSTIGMMDGAFFVGRKEIMDWINSTLSLNLTKIEDTANGAVACQLLDIMYPEKVPMNKVNWLAKQSFEFVANYKILQTCFTKLNIERHIDVDRLISGKYMDNLEFMQWFKRFFEMSVSDVRNYDAYAQRCKGKGGSTYNGGSKKASIVSAKPTSAPVEKASATINSATINSAPIKPLPAPAATVVVQKNKTFEQENTVPNVNHLSNSNSHDSILQENIQLKASNQDSTRAYAELRTEMEGLEKERDFYFEKLRDIEILLQDIEDKGEGTELTASIFKILYATADGFEQVPSSVDTNITVQGNQHDEIALQDTY